jgi:HEAT repeat protein
VLESLDHPETQKSLAIKPGDAVLLGEIVRGLMNLVRGDSRARLRDILRQAGALSEYLAELRNGVERGQLEAIDNLVMFDTPEVIEALWTATNDDNPAVRLAAGQAYAELGDPLRFIELVQRLEIGRSVKSRGLRDMFRRIGARAPAQLAAILATTDNPQTMVLAISGLGHSRDYNLIPEIAKLAASSWVDVRAEVMRTLGIFGHPLGGEAALKGLSDTSWEVRAQAAVAIGRIGVPEALPILERLLDDGEWWVRFRSAAALAKLGESGLLVLRQAAATTSFSGRAAQMILAELAAA